MSPDGMDRAKALQEASDEETWRLERMSPQERCDAAWRGFARAEMGKEWSRKLYG